MNGLDYGIQLFSGTLITDTTTELASGSNLSIKIAGLTAGSVEIQFQDGGTWRSYLNFTYTASAREFARMPAGDRVRVKLIGATFDYIEVQPAGSGGA